jgi:hypothetical protein
MSTYDLAINGEEFLRLDGKDDMGTESTMARIVAMVYDIMAHLHPESATKEGYDSDYEVLMVKVEPTSKDVWDAVGTVGCTILFVSLFAVPWLLGKLYPSLGALTIGDLQDWISGIDWAAVDPVDVAWTAGKIAGAVWGMWFTYTLISRRKE